MKSWVPQEYKQTAVFIYKSKSQFHKFHDHNFIYHIENSCFSYVNPYPMGGRHIVLLLSTSWSVSHQLLRDPQLNFFLVVMFFVPQVICIWFLLWPWYLGSRSSFESVFCCYEFFHYFIFCMREILIKPGRKLYRHLTHDPIIVDL